MNCPWGGSLPFPSSCLGTYLIQKLLLFIKSQSNQSQYKRTIWTTMFVPSEILFCDGTLSFCLEIGAALFAGLGQSSKGTLRKQNHTACPQISVPFTALQLAMHSETYFPEISFRQPPRHCAIITQRQQRYVKQ